ncbi:MAG: GNAT family N-acetyltransferase [Rhodospirillales bacterium]|nr:GNAT family N-acetyltransferase [Rhodospirillales bacterium]
MAKSPRRSGAGEARIRPATAADLAGVIALDAETTGLAKPEYWQDMFRRYGGRRGGQACFLVAIAEDRVEGFIVGEVRAWEFGSPPCGWVFAVQVRSGRRLAGLGSRLFDAVCDTFRAAGVDRVRTMLARDNTVIHAFFRSQGMTAGPFIQLETRLD